MPPLEALVEAYADALRSKERGADVAALCRAGLPHFDLFSSVGYFRIASICRGVYSRAKMGTASSAIAPSTGALETSTAKLPPDTTSAQRSRTSDSVSAFKAAAAW